MGSFAAAPFLRVVVVALAAIFCLLAPGAVDTAEARSPGNVEHIARDLFHRLNDERAARGLHPVAWDNDLAWLATTWSARMSDTRDYRHSDMGAAMATSPFRERFSYVGENIYLLYPHYESAGYAHQGWMRSDGHRRNMLNAYHDAVGIGIICDADGTMWATLNMGRYTGSTRPAYQHSVAPNPIVHDNAGGPACRDHNSSGTGVLPALTGALSAVLPAAPGPVAPAPGGPAVPAQTTAPAPTAPTPAPASPTVADPEPAPAAAEAAAPVAGQDDAGVHPWSPRNATERGFPTLASSGRQAQPVGAPTPAAPTALAAVLLLIALAGHGIRRLRHT